MTFSPDLAALALGLAAIGLAPYANADAVSHNPTGAARESVSRPHAVRALAVSTVKLAQRVPVTREVAQTTWATRSSVSGEVDEAGQPASIIPIVAWAGFVSLVFTLSLALIRTKAG